MLTFNSLYKFTVQYIVNMNQLLLEMNSREMDRVVVSFRCSVEMQQLCTSGDFTGICAHILN